MSKKGFSGSKAFSKIVITLIAAVFVIAIIASVYLFAVSSPTVTPVTLARVPIRYAVDLPGTYGYTVGSVIIDFLEMGFPDEYDFSLVTFPTTTAANKAVMDRQAEIGQSGTSLLKDLYAGGGLFEGYTPKFGKKLVHTAYLYTHEVFLAVLSSEASKYHSWRDLSGKPMFFTKSGWGTWILLKYVWRVLGYEFNHVEVDPATVADALKAGTIVATGLYTSSMVSLPAWIKELELKADLTIVNPSPEEIKKLQDAGFIVVSVDPKKVFTKDVGVKEIKAVLFAYGLVTTTDMSEEFVYTLLKVLERYVGNITRVEPGLWQLRDRMVELQVLGVKSAPEVPVHPGLAKFLKEKNAWDPSWKVAS